MGKTRTKLIDDSIKEESQVSRVKSQEKKASKKREEDSLVAKLREELGIEEEKKEKLSLDSARDRDVGSEKIEKEVRDLKLEEKRKIKHPTSKKIRSKKYQAVSKDLDRSKYYSLTEALDIVKNKSYAKFNDGPGTLEVHINTAQTGIRGLVSLPYAAGRKIRIVGFGKDAAESGVDIVGSDQVLADIEKGKINFDLIITTPEWMPKLAKVARILGPKGLMPNPKNGTITEDLKKAVEDFQAGKTEYKTEPKAPVIHLGLGKLTQPNEELAANVKQLLQTVGKSKIKKVTLSPTMGPGVKVDLASV